MPDFTRRNSDSGGDASLPEINYTDQLLDALSSERPVYSNDAGESELAYLLAGWRDEVRQAPLTATVTPRDAALALDRASAPAVAPPRRRLGLAVAGSVAAAVLCLGGFSSVIYGAGPGDALYNLRTMFFGEQQATRDDQVALAAQTQMAEVQQLIDQGDWTAAQDRLQTITTTVAAVGDVERQQELADQWQELSVKVETRDVNATVPADAPPVVLPEVPSDLPLPVLLSPESITSTTSPVTTSPVTTTPLTTPPPATTPSTTPPPATPSTSPPPATSAPDATPSPTPTSPPAPSPTSRPPATTPSPTPSQVPAVTTTTQAPVAASPTSAAPASPSAPVTLSTTTVAPVTSAAPATTVPAPAAPPTTTVVAPPVRVQSPAPPVEAPAVQVPEIVITTTTVAGLPE